MQKLINSHVKIMEVKYFDFNDLMKNHKAEKPSIQCIAQKHHESVFISMNEKVALETCEIVCMSSANTKLVFNDWISK